MRRNNFDLSLSINDVINEIVKTYKTIEEVVGIYKICYEESEKNIIEINLIFKNCLHLPVYYERFAKYNIDNKFLNINLKGHHSEFYKPKSYFASEEIITAYKDILCREILFEKDDLLTDFRNHTLNMQENGIYPFGCRPMEYDNLIEFKPMIKKRKKGNNE